MIDNLKKFLNEEQDPNAVEKIAGKLNELLMSGEVVEYIAVQKKPAVNIAPDSIALTNKRIIFCRPRNLGISMDFTDYLWKDITDCHVKEGMLGSDFTMRTVKGGEDKIDYLPKTQARKLYAIVQEQEEKQREYRRQLDLEDKRAAAGNISLSASTPAPAAPTPPVAEDEIMALLKKLKSLFENDLISQQEYEAKKAEILARL
ncbi:MAG TPA: PH domain-containing protein [Saprospiraceae bacterium]|nr:PH domain-containing protein [Saprospiraceae bacterium]HPN69530.1 PH domain-containing protein [Saprospiraceae bacterium]